jgi:hypothetical protein
MISSSGGGPDGGISANSTWSSSLSFGAAAVVFPFGIIVRVGFELDFGSTRDMSAALGVSSIALLKIERLQELF